MKKQYLLLFFIINQTFFGQISITPPKDFEGNEDFKNVKKIDNAIITKYKIQTGFAKLDSLEKLKFRQHKSELSFNSNGKVIKYSETEFIDGDEYETKNTIFEYNSENKILNLKTQDQQKEVFEYINNSENINQYIYGYDFLKYDKIIKYSIKNGLILNTKIYYNDGTLIGEEEYKYNSKNDLVYDKRYGVITKITLEYNSFNKIIKKSSINNYKKGIIEITKYNTENQSSEIQYLTLNGVLRNKEIFEYQNNLINKKKDFSYYKGKISDVEITTYKYDNNQNWIEKEIVKNEIPKELVKREIHYK
nr:hypothetical protein [uncultured Flavobacterium sp.]